VAHDPALQIVIVQQRHEAIGIAIAAFERVVVVQYTQRLIVV
jgi:hypothetical protein